MDEFLIATILAFLYLLALVVIRDSIPIWDKALRSKPKDEDKDHTDLYDPERRGYERARRKKET